MVLTDPHPPTRDRAAVETAASLLSELQQAHDALADAMRAIERMTCEPVPEKSQFTEARWRISRASLTRRLLWTRILGFLLGRVGNRAADELRRLQEDDIALMRASIQHVSRWTTQNALADWTGYCEASRDIRARMQEAMEAEKRLLYPMLDAASRGEGPS